MQPAERLNQVSEYYFSAKLREIEAMNKAGKNVINLGIGSPDLPPHPEVMATLQEEAAKAGNHAYQSYKGSLTFRQAIADWYAKWYDASVDPETEILPLIGSKEGIMHICMTYFQEGDAVLVPDPGYPTYAAAVNISGATPMPFSLNEANNFEPDFEQIEKQILENAELNFKAMFINYPHMPTGKNGSVELFEKVIAFAKKNKLLIIHDNPYSFILNEKPLSLLAVPGAMDVAIELNSLSKSHNMAGWRIGMMIASKQRIDEVLKFKSNMDSGMFLPLQLSAAKALSLGEDWFDSLNEVYKKRRNLVYQLLDLLKCSYTTTQCGMFVWASIPTEEKDGFAFSDKVLSAANVFITPGGIFGKEGLMNVRISLCSNEEKLEIAMNRITASKVITHV